MVHIVLLTEYDNGLSTVTYKSGFYLKTQSIKTENENLHIYALIHFIVESKISIMSFLCLLDDSTITYFE